MEYEYKWLPGTLVPQDLLAQLAALYSQHYGLWSLQDDRNPGGRIRLSPERIGKLLASNEAKLAYATIDNALVGYAIAIQAKIPDYGVISWVTQLVVHEDHRRKDVGRSLLFAIWTFTDHFAWGLLTANPYAIRALEKATRCRCLPARIVRNHRKLKTMALQYVPYVMPDTQVEVSQEVSRINTRFMLDHTELPEMLQRVISPSVPWRLGPIDEGWEWFAFTFHDQREIDLTSDEIEAMLKSSDQVAKRAYSRMLLHEGHRWAQHAASEAHFVVSVCDAKPGSASVLDLGCGTGRHSLELSAMGFDVMGIDYVDSLVEKAQHEARRQQLRNVRFEVGDSRSIDLERQFDIVLCLYDVIGTYADEKENARILETVFRHLKPGGRALMSVMNLDFTRRRAKHTFSLAKDPNRLLALPPSRTMEQTGDIFDPNYYMIDVETEIIYRKEQFAGGTALPVELIVRDRRYRQPQIEMMCVGAGLKVLWSRLVHAGHWNEPLEADDDRAKEILLCCSRS